MSSYHHDARPRSRSRGGKVVKPILRKFTQSEKNSLDLDRPAVEQQEALGIYDSRSAHDVAFVHTTRRGGYHIRSTSGTSQFSTATSGSGHRTGSFVHPFQQTPRPYTPPLAASNSYQNSLRESEHDTSTQVLAEDDEQQQQQQHRPQLHLRTSSGLANANTNNSNNHAPSSASTATSNNLNSQPLRIQTKHSTVASSRLARASHTSLSSTLILSPDITSPSETMSPVSAIRDSFDRGFRLRSRSDIAQTVEEARRAFDEREKVKEEKAAREEIKKMKKRNEKEAEKHLLGGGGSGAIGGAHNLRSSPGEPARFKRSKSDPMFQYEKSPFGHEYDSALMEEPPAMGNEGFEQPQRSLTTSSARNFKKKSNGTFHAVMMWIRTRLLRIKKRSSSY